MDPESIHLTFEQELEARRLAHQRRRADRQRTVNERERDLDRAFESLLALEADVVRRERVLDDARSGLAESRAFLKQLSGNRLVSRFMSSIATEARRQAEHLGDILEQLPRR